MSIFMYLDLLTFQLPEYLCLRYNAKLCGVWGNGNAERQCFQLSTLLIRRDKIPQYYTLGFIRRCTAYDKVAFPFILKMLGLEQPFQASWDLQVVLSL